MKKVDMNLKLRKGRRLDEIVEIFERESPIVHTIIKLKSCTNKIVIIGIIYLLIIICIKQYNLLTSIVASSLFTGTMIYNIYKMAGEISYIYSKEIGGKKAKSVFKKQQGVVQTIFYNIELMKKEEWKLVNKILKVNHLYNRNTVQELKYYFGKRRGKSTYEINDFLKNLIGVYLIPITFGVISIYTAIFNNMSMEQNIIDILYIVVLSIIILTIFTIIYIIYRMKKISITDIYTFPRLEKILLEILLN